MSTTQHGEFRLTASAWVIGLLLGLNACTSSDNALKPDPARHQSGRESAVEPEFFVLTDDNRLNKKSLLNPAADLSSTGISGLQDNEKMLAIDFRPATGQLYGLGSTSRIYVINQETGAARAVSTDAFSPALSGDAIGFDFNPTVDLIRVVTNTGQNLRLNPNTGLLQPGGQDGAINGGMNPTISAVAYTNSKGVARNTTLYDIDPVSDRLYIQNPPNNGTLVEVGSLEKDIAGTAGFDISSDNNYALLAYQIGGKSELGRVDLTKGAIKTLGGLGPKTIIGLAIPTDPVAYAVSGNDLLIFNPWDLGPTLRNITGLQPGETIRGIDMRPATGQLYALGTSSRIYAVSYPAGTTNAQLTVVGSGAFTPALTGSDYGFDFNPTVDRIRVISNSGQNLRINPVTGEVTVDKPLNYGPTAVDKPSVRAAAYSNNFQGATTTVLYDLDDFSNRLYRQVPPNDGTVVGGSPLGIDITGTNGFDIGGRSNKGYALLTSGNSTNLYMIDLNNGGLTNMGQFSTTVRGFCIGLGF
ncbi:hypothetical protein GCM10028803_25110 [Larkinella knui]|uniref:DUF4394 domain-containing protein n=1 Tax=Larkinella knui TaxID=2025310 RepID=A0A3P1CVY1_9BACT|nr:DUF4394 domain-containing protein [Larkinella knui]RRB17567.1 DUF4394 domain-containing protein [Larkinella knui]